MFRRKAYRQAVRLSSPLDALGQHHREFARTQRRAGAVHVERALHAHHAREPPEVPLHQVIGHRVGRGLSRFLAGHDHDALSEEHPQQCRRHAGSVHYQLDYFVGLEDVHKGTAGAGHGRRTRPALGQFVEELANVVGQIAPFAWLNKGKLGHRPAIIQALFRFQSPACSLQSLVQCGSCSKLNQPEARQRRTVTIKAI